MTEKERIETFLTAFKELEADLIEKSDFSLDYHISFSKALSEIYYKKKNAVISNYDNYDFLKTCADLRNILSHENNVCSPSEEFLTKFIHLKERIIHPLKVESIMTKDIFTCSLNDSLLNIMKKMEYKSLSHVPVIEDGSVYGVFSRSTIFDYISMNEDFDFKDDIKISYFDEFLPLDSHLNERFIFVKRDEKVDNIFNYLNKEKEHEKNVALLLVTQNGKKNEKLLGIITSTDLNKYKD